jgi:hypothetical protein
MAGARSRFLLVIVASLVAAWLAALAGSAQAVSTTGYDISYPQCNASFPASPGFGIVGVNGGRPYSANPCLGTGDGPSELSWAGMNAQLYANTADPGPALSTHWPNGQTSPQQCNTAANPGSDTAQCAYDYGWNAAGDSYQDTVNAYVALGWAPSGATRTPVANAWWLDVESANSWTSNTSFNVDALQGEADYLKSVGAASVGFYATASDWQTITGATTSFAAYASWLPGASSLAQAQANCNGAGVTGGGIALTQYPSGGFDGDYRCAAPAPSPSLSFASAPQTLTAGSPSAPMSVALSQAVSSATSVTLTSSSSGGGFATSSAGPWSSSLTASVPAGSTASGGFYYRDTRAGQPVLTAAASGYSNATQTETIGAGALATIAIMPASAQLRVGAQQSFSATGQDGYGNAVTVTPSWSVSPALGTFSANTGNPVTFTARSTGSGTITAAVGAVAGNASITVTARKRGSTAAPTLRTFLRMLPARGCVRGRFVRVRPRRQGVDGLVTVRVLLDGKLVKTLGGPGLARGADLNVPSQSRFTVTVVGLTRAGQTLTATYRYQMCSTGTVRRANQPPTMLPAIPGG